MNATVQQALNLVNAYTTNNSLLPHHPTQHQQQQQPITVNVFWKYTFGIIMAIMAVLSVFENVVLIMNHSRRRRPTSFHVRCMALCDLITALCVGPLFAYYLSKKTLIHYGAGGGAIRQYYFITVYLSAFAFSANFLNVRQRCVYLKTLQQHRICEVLYSVLCVNLCVPVLLSVLTLIDGSVCKDVVFLVLGVLDAGVIGVYVALFVVSRSRKAEQKKRFEIVFMKKEQQGRDTPLMFLSTRTN